jgi:phthalate 4,5-dioxygenase
MLSHEDNERLVRVSKGTPLGELFRLYWIPFLPSKDLKKDGQPKKIRLLGEDLVAFRDSEGRVGLVDEACPHRRAPLVFGRNEDCGLRCVYHGWKFDVTGAVTEMPAEPTRSRLKERVRIKAYACKERNGMIWTYMGADQTNLPPLPNVEWNLVPEEQVHISLRIQECNWLQAVEGEIDSAHAPVLHGRLDSKGTTSEWVQKRDMRPTFECVKQEFGMSIAARRNYDANTLYWRVNQFMLPFYTLVPPLAPFPDLSGHAWVPIDDENTLCLMFSYHPSQPLLDKTRQIFSEGHNGRESGHASRNSLEKRPVTVPYSDYWTKYNPQNAFQFDYEAQETTWFSGLPGLWVQDGACQSGVAPILDRTKENLCSSDTGIAMTRRFILEAIGAYRDHGVVPRGVTDPDVFMARAIAIKLPPEDSWVDIGGPFMRAKLGTDFGYDV